eukprot:540993_1
MNNSLEVNYNALLKSKVIKTDDEITSRENKLISFCEWLNKIYDSLCNTKNFYAISIFKDLENWLNDIQRKWNQYLCDACVDELKICNNLLIENGAQSWINVEKLLNECKSLRKVDYVSDNTSQEYFKTLNEFDSSKTSLAKDAALLIDEFNKNDDENINYDKIIKIANQLYKAGCKTESSEMKQIYFKLKQHLTDLEAKTKAIALSIDMPDDLIVIQNTMKELDILQSKFATFMPDIKKD